MSACRTKSLLFCFSLLLLIVNGCSSSRPIGKTEAEALYKEAMDLTQKERYLLAIEKINAIKSQYPYSFYATHAELLHADILFMQENYIEAAAAYILFRDLHPKHEKLGHVIWRIAESYYFQLPSTYDRDLAAAGEALKYYQEVIDKFPNSEYVSSSQDRIKQIERMLLQKDLYIADFYFKTEVYDAAKFRYRDILKKYQDEQDVQNLAMLRIVESSLNANEYDECIKLAGEYAQKLPTDAKKRVSILGEECNKLKSKVD